MIRVLVILAVIGLLVLLVKRWLAGPPQNREAAKPGNTRMVRCDYCGLHVPEPEALREGAKHYCSREHLLAADRQR